MNTDDSKKINIISFILLCLIPGGMVCVQEFTYVLWKAAFGDSCALGAASCVAYVLCILIFGGIAIGWHLKPDNSVSKHTGQQRVVVKHALFITFFCVLIGLALQIFTSGIIELATYILPDFIDSYKSSMNDSFSASLGFSRIFSVIFLAPIAEELAFRFVGLRLAYGIPKGDCSERTRRIIAIVITSVLFGLYHGNIVQFCYAFVCGLIMAAIDLAYGSVLPSLVIHWAVNASAYLPTGVLYDKAETTAVSAAVSVLVIILSLLYILKASRRLSR